MYLTMFTLRLGVWCIVIWLFMVGSRILLLLCDPVNFMVRLVWKALLVAVISGNL